MLNSLIYPIGIQIAKTVGSILDNTLQQAALFALDLRYHQLL